MELSTIIPHIEALIFASDKPLTSLDIVELINNAFGFMEERISLDQVESAVEGIREKYNAEFYSFEIRQSGGGFQFLTKKDYYKTVAQLNGDKFLKRLSNAALETLAIIAYKQPITKGEVEAIRGVNSDYSIQKLLEKELIVITGRNEELPGKPLVYCTSKSFMDYFGINSTDDLPKIKEVLAEQAVQGTLIDDAINNRIETEDVILEEVSIDDSGTGLIVADNGELIEQTLDKDAATENTTSNTPGSSNEDKQFEKRDEDPPGDDLSKTSPEQTKEG
jgi:segregation and condensation protein B